VFGKITVHVRSLGPHRYFNNSRRMILTWGSNSVWAQNKLQENSNFFRFVLWSNEATFKSDETLTGTICIIGISWRSQLTLDEKCRSSTPIDINVWNYWSLVNWTILFCGISNKKPKGLFVFLEMIFQI